VWWFLLLAFLSQNLKVCHLIAPRGDGVHYCRYDRHHHHHHQNPVILSTVEQCPLTAFEIFASSISVMVSKDRS